MRHTTHCDTYSATHTSTHTTSHTTTHAATHTVCESWRRALESVVAVRPPTPLAAVTSPHNPPATNAATTATVAAAAATASKACEEVARGLAQEEHVAACWECVRVAVEVCGEVGGALTTAHTENVRGRHTAIHCNILQQTEIHCNMRGARDGAYRECAR